MYKIQSESELIDNLKKDIATCTQQNILFFCAHFPLVYKKNADAALEAVTLWGPFTLYTLELSCILGQYAQNLGKTVQFVFFVDDHMYEDICNLHSRERSNRRNNLYMKRSGKNAKLAPEFKKIMDKYGFDEHHVIRQNQNKEHRTDCLYFSEKILRASSRNITNPCAREYTEFFDNPIYFDNKKTYLISFIPNRCQKNICNDALTIELPDMQSSHIFMETMMPTLSQSELYTRGRGVIYRKDT